MDTHTHTEKRAVFDMFEKWPLLTLKSLNTELSQAAGTVCVNEGRMFEVKRKKGIKVALATMLDFIRFIYPSFSSFVTCIISGRTRGPFISTT